VVQDPHLVKPTKSILLPRTILHIKSTVPATAHTEFRYLSRNSRFPSFSMTPPSSLSPEDQRLLDFRNTTNFRSVTRNDPSIIEIIETSVYSVIYHYDETAGAWEKQKQEGPMFIVGRWVGPYLRILTASCIWELVANEGHRDKSPEYALYMLNRQMVKNVTLPLVPGEMKLTVVDTATLQVARRGESTLHVRVTRQC